MAIQEQLNIREGRPSVFATEARAPPVVHDHIAQQVFTDETPEGPGGVRGLFRYVVNLVVSMCYSTITSVLNLLLSFVRNDDRRCKFFHYFLTIQIELSTNKKFKYLFTLIFDIDRADL